MADNRFVSFFKQKDVMKKVLFTLLILVLYRVGCYLPVPGIPTHEFAEAFNEANSGMGAMAVLDIFTGGALSNLGILSLGIMPYITASIIMQLMAIVIPQVGEWRREGAEGRRNIVKWTRILTVFIGFVNALGYDLLFKSTQYGIVYNSEVPGILNDIMVIFALMVGVVLIMWMGELITQHGIGNGMSVIIFTSVISRVAPAIWESITTSGGGDATGMAITVIVFIAIIVIIPALVFVERSQRRIPVNSTKAGASSRFAQRSERNYIAFKPSANAMYAIIFASCFQYMPAQIAAFLNVDWLTTFANKITTPPVSFAVMTVLILLFMFFCNSMNYDLDHQAEDLKSRGSFIPGVRPGYETAKFLKTIVSRITWIGTLYTLVVAVGSSMLFATTGNPLLQAFGGTSVLIIVGVSMQIMAALEQSLHSNDPEAVLRRLG